MKTEIKQLKKILQAQVFNIFVKNVETNKKFNIKSKT